MSLSTLHSPSSHHDNELIPRSGPTPTSPSSSPRKRRPHSPPPPLQQPRHRPSSLSNIWTWMRTRSCPAISTNHEAAQQTPTTTSPDASTLHLPVEALYYMNACNGRLDPHASTSTLDSMADAVECASRGRAMGKWVDMGMGMSGERARGGSGGRDVGTRRVVTFEDEAGRDVGRERGFMESTVGTTAVGGESDAGNGVHEGEGEGVKPKRYRGINEKDWLKRAFRRVVRKFRRRFRGR